MWIVKKFRAGQTSATAKNFYKKLINPPHPTYCFSSECHNATNSQPSTIEALQFNTTNNLLTTTCGGFPMSLDVIFVLDNEQNDNKDFRKLAFLLHRYFSLRSLPSFSHFLQLIDLSAFESGIELSLCRPKSIFFSFNNRTYLTKYQSCLISQ